MRYYICLIHKDVDSDYGVSFPDFPGCITVGDNMDDALDMAKEALEFHIDGLIKDDIEFPENSAKTFIEYPNLDRSKGKRSVHMIYLNN